jgi:hypothetical protein
MFSSKVNKQFLIDAAERVGFVTLYAVASVVTVDLFNLPEWAVVPMSMFLAAIKSYAARHVGNPASGGITTPPE